jgi:hypothetical protein
LVAGPVALRQCVEHFTCATFQVVGLQPTVGGRPPGRVFVAAPMEVFPLNWKCEWCGPARPPTAPLVVRRLGSDHQPDCNKVSITATEHQGRIRAA